VTIEDFERDVVTALLAGDDPLLATLREQYAAATVRDRERQAGGATVYFDVPASAAPIERKRMHLDDLQVQLEGAATPAEVALQVQDGRLATLEYFVYDGTFPAAPRIVEAWYYGTKRYPGITAELMAERDLEDVLDEDE
jgi:hypothetical protein